MALADGVPIWKVLDDLRHIKLPKNVRARVVSLDEEYKTGSLHIDDQDWLRRMYNRRAAQIKELHRSYDAVRETDARIRRGSAKDRLVRLRAKRLTRKRLEQRKEQLETEIAQHEAEEKDFGI